MRNNLFFLNNITLLVYQDIALDKTDININDILLAITFILTKYPYILASYLSLNLSLTVISRNKLIFEIRDMTMNRNIRL